MGKKNDVDDERRIAQLRAAAEYLASLLVGCERSELQVELKRTDDGREVRITFAGGEYAGVFAFHRRAEQVLSARDVAALLRAMEHASQPLDFIDRTVSELATRIEKRVKK